MGEMMGDDFRPGGRIIWLYSKKRSFVVGCGVVQRIPAVIIQICKSRIRLMVLEPGTKKVVNVSPDNVVFEEECYF
jgi:hypothetical protein